MGPEIADRRRRPSRPRDPPLDTDLRLGEPAVQQGDPLVAVLQGFGEHLEITVLADASGLDPERILVQLDHLDVRQRLDRVVVHAGQIAPDDQRRREDRPHREVRAVLLSGGAVPDERPLAPEVHDEHVVVVPSPGARVLLESDAAVDHVEHVEVVALAMPRQVEVVGDVLSDPPMLPADLASPGPHVVPAAVAHVQHDVAARGPERVGHRAVQVRDIWRSLAGPAARVVLQMVDAPRGEQLRVLALVAAAARVPGTRLDPGAGVDAQLQAALVHGVGEEPDPPWELVGVVLEVVEEARSAHPLPAVIEHHVLPADIAHAAVDHGVGRREDPALVDVGAVHVPAVPPHRRGGGQGSGVRRRRSRRRVDVLVGRLRVARGQDRGHPGKCEADDRPPEELTTLHERPPSGLEVETDRVSPGPRDLTESSSRGTYIEPICKVDISSCSIIHRTKGTRPDVGTRDPRLC